MAETITSDEFGKIPLTETMLTKKGVDAAIASAVTSVYKYIGSASVSDLNTLAPSVANADETLKVGHVYNVTSDGTLAAGSVAVVTGDNVAWTSSGWDKQAASFNPAGLQTKITASGILKGDGSGGVTAATPGTDYVASLSQASDAVVTVTGSNGALTVDHAKKGPSSSGNTSKGDTTAQTPGFGDTFKAISATVDKYGHVTALAEHNVTIPSATAVATGTTGAKNGLMSADDKAKLNGVATGAQANVIEGVKLAGASGNLTPSSKVVTIPNAVATGETGATNGLMTADDKKTLGDLSSNAVTGIGTLTNNVSASISNGEINIGVAAGTSSTSGVVYLSDSVSESSAAASGHTAATPFAVKTAYNAAIAADDKAVNAQTRVTAIESAAGTLYTALAGLDATSMTTANAIKTLVSSLLSYLKAFAAASDNDNSTSYSAS